MAVEHVQTKREIEGLLTATGLKPKTRRFGQHFLIDGNLMRSLAESAEIVPGDAVLEVGAGTGGLTDLLVGRAERVLAVEMDRNLVSILKARFADRANLCLVEGDVLSGKHRLNEDVVRRLDADHPMIQPWKLVANLPYQVATPLVAILLQNHPTVARMCFTVQAEVGERLRAETGSRDYGPLAILVQTVSTIRTLARVPAQAFWPRPQVESLMLVLDRIELPNFNPADLKPFSQLTRAVFDHRRKSLRTALDYVVDRECREAVCGSFQGSRRPETLNVSEWHELYRLVLKTGWTPPGIR